MHDFMKTIISAIQSWTNDKIVDSTADWGQNDSSASNYIKNRTHWEDDPTTVILLTETTFEFSAAGPDGRQYIGDLAIEDGKTYIVTWDGQTYECIARGYAGSYHLGNNSLLGSSGGNGEPFWVGSYSGYAIMASEVGTHTVSISTQQSIVHKLDAKYLPESINDSFNALYEEVWSAQDDAYDAKNTVDNKMDKNNPVGTGSFSMNRKVGTTIGSYSHAEGLTTTASAHAAHAEGLLSTASAQASHAEGQTTTASGTASHAEGFQSKASGTYSHAEGCNAAAFSWCSHAEGYETISNSAYAHAEGCGTKAHTKSQHVQGEYNISEAIKVNDRGKYANIVGNGTSDTSRSNAHTLDWEGNAWYQGEVYVGGTGQDDATARLLKTSETATDNDVLDVLSEMSYIDPIASSDGSIYTNNNGEIYIL